MYSDVIDYTSEKFHFYLQSPINGSILFTTAADDSAEIFINRASVSNVSYADSLKTFSYSMELNSYYYFTVKHQEDAEEAYFYLLWNYTVPSSIPGMAGGSAFSYSTMPLIFVNGNYTYPGAYTISTSSFYVPKYVSGQVFNVTVSCPTGYLGSPTYSVCTSVCGNNVIVESEE